MQRSAIRSDDAERIKDEAVERLREEIDALAPLLMRLAKRCGGAWTDAEQAEWEPAVEALFEELEGEFRHALRAAAVPASVEELDS